MHYEGSPSQFGPSILKWYRVMYKILPYVDKSKKSANSRLWYLKNRESILKRCAEYRETHREQIRQFFRRTYWENRPKKLADGARYRAIHRDEIRARDRCKIRFRDKRIRLLESPRRGICSSCGKTSRYTHIHHDIYDPTNILANTRELCPTCHGRISGKSRLRDPVTHHFA